MHDPMKFRYRQVAGPDGQGYTDVWVDGKYSRIQALVSAVQALQMVRSSRKTYSFTD